MKLFLLFCSLFFTFFIGISLRALEQIDKGIQAVQPNEYEIVKRWDKRQHLQGVWNLFKVFSSDGISFKELQNKSYKWWKTESKNKFKKQLVPLDWHRPYPSKKLSKRLADARAGFYSIKLETPNNFDWKRAILHFDNVNSECKVYINDQLVTSHKNLFMQARHIDTTHLEDFEVDISKYLNRNGSNTLNVLVFGGPKVKIWGIETSDLAGINGPVWIDYHNTETLLTNVFLTPNVKNMKLKIELKKDSIGSISEVSKLNFIIAPWVGVGKKFSEGKSVNWIDNSANIQISMTGATLWDTDNPFLYKLEVRDINGELLKRERFGFRTFEAREGKFYLNNKAIWLRGNLFDSGIVALQAHELDYNYGGFLRTRLEIFKKPGNVNYVRIHNGGQAKVFYDLCDELGMLVSEEFDITSTPLKADDPRKVADFIARNNIIRLFDNDGNLRNKAKELFKHFPERIHNNPSVVLFNTGNERSPDKWFAKYAKIFYKIVHESDRQNRPIASWGSGVHLELGSTNWDIPTDYFDFHNYDSTLGGGYWKSTIRGQIEEYNRSIREANLANIPIIDGETIGTLLRLQRFNTIYKSFREDSSLKNIFLDWVNNKPQWNRNIFYNHSSVLAKLGIRAFKNKETLLNAHGRRLKILLETQRRELDFLQGIVCLGTTNDFYWSGTPGLYALDPLKTKVEKILPYPIQMGVAYAPLWISAYPFKHNLSQGKRLKINALVHNGLNETKENLTLEVRLFDVNQNEVFNTKQTLAKITVNERIEVVFNVNIPKNMALENAELLLIIKLADERIFTNSYDLQIFQKTKISIPDDISEIVLYGESAVVGTILSYSGINFKVLKKIENISSPKFLIFAPNSMNQDIEINSNKIREWIKGGTKVLVLAQNKYSGAVPFFSEYRFTQVKSQPFADMLDDKHPIFSNINPESLRDWGGYGTIFTSFLNMNLNEIDDTILIGGVASFGDLKRIAFGMVAAEVRLGSGAILFSQLQASKFYIKDIAARTYLNNLISYLISPNFGKNALLSKGKAKKISYYSRENSYFIPLKGKANSSLYDKTANDGLGGWADLGRDNLNHLKRKEYRFFGINYHIAKEGRKNNWKNCIILGGSVRPNITKKVEGIKVGKKLKIIGFLHTSMWVRAKKKELLGNYTVNYSDGSNVKIPLKNKVNIADWWAKSNQSKCMVAKIVSSPSNNRYAIYTYTWDNPYPEKMIESIDMSSTGKGILALLAITGIKK